MSGREVSTEYSCEDISKLQWEEDTQVEIYGAYMAEWSLLGVSREDWWSKFELDHTPL